MKESSDLNHRTREDVHHALHVWAKHIINATPCSANLIQLHGKQGGN